MKVNLNGDEKHYRTVWMQSGLVKMIDQHLLPHDFKIVQFKDYIETSDSISNMTVRGAGAIGATAAYATAQLAMEAYARYPDNPEYFWKFVDYGVSYIKNARPTANALFTAVDKVYSDMLKAEDLISAKMFGLTSAGDFANGDAASCKSIGEYGADIIQKYMREQSLDRISVLTHCNAGWLAFVDYGSALSPVYELKRRGVEVKVFADETRPYNQGSRLTAWELKNEGVDVEIVPDNHAGALMARSLVDMVIVGADRIAANGDTANKIGTYMVATMAKQHNVPFYVAAPKHTFDFSAMSGNEIPIEERSASEASWVKGVDREGCRREVKFAADGVNSRYIAFDVTPHHMINGFITDHGVMRFSELPDKLADDKEKVIAHYGNNF